MSSAYYHWITPHLTRRCFAVPDVRLGSVRSFRIHGPTRHFILHQDPRLMSLRRRDNLLAFPAYTRHAKSLISSRIAPVFLTGNLESTLQCLVIEFVTLDCSWTLSYRIMRAGSPFPLDLRKSQRILDLRRMVDSACGSVGSRAQTKPVICE